jgi:tRNA 2-selenouridine synthase
MTVITIEDAVSLWKEHLLIDVRSQDEYKNGHIPCAINLPILDNEERAVIGTLYKKSNRQTAIKKGLDYFGPKMKFFVEEVENLLSKKTYRDHSTVIIYCWRGGMRSNIMGWLLTLYGFKVKLIKGGYKSFRNWCLDVFDRDNQYILIGGFTGSGKTEIINKLSKRYNEPVIDLEGLAKHRGSAFGGIGMENQPSQEMFENLLALRLHDLFDSSHYILLEDESQRIGMVSIPQLLWNRMRLSKLIFLKLSFEKRLENIINDYGKLDRSLLSSAIIRLQKKLGGLDTKNCLAYLVNKDIEGCFNLLLKYYDKVYLKSLDKKCHGLTALHEFHIEGMDEELMSLSQMIKNI